MKKYRIVVALLCCLAGLYSCDDTGIDLGINDPQHIQWVEEIIDNDLLQAFGEENIHFGHTPPDLHDVSFVINELWYDSCIRYRPVTILGVTNIEPSYSSGGVEVTVYKHHFFNHIENLAQQRVFIKSHNNDDPNLKPIDVPSTFVIGSGNDFSAYFQAKTISEKEGNPTWAYLISGTVVNDPDLGKCISNYKIGKKILTIDFDPVAGYYPKTIMIMRPLDNTAPIPCVVWDTIP